MTTCHTIRNTDSLLLDPDVLDEAILSVVRKLEQSASYHHARHVRSWTALEQEALRQAQFMVKEKGAEAVFGRPTSWWVRWLGGKPNRTRIDVSLDKGNVTVHITPIAV